MIVRPAAIVDAIDGVDKPWGQSGGGPRGVGTGSAAVPVPRGVPAAAVLYVLRVLYVLNVLGIRRPPPLAEDAEDAEDVEDAEDSGRRNTVGRRAE